MTAASTARQRHVICMKWGTKYGPEYVNRLYAMVRRHLSG
ncbi:MAG TPA: glycosyltransferase, partial [Comamonadaceae bacterium]|nr:glycosyltransferase [Comamonadaceae bacterium]